MWDFLIYAALAGVGVAIVAGPLGSLVVWRRMAYFGDTLAHSALLGITLGILLNINLNVSVIICCLLLALLLVNLQHRKLLATDTLLGILAHSTLALGLIAVSFFQELRLDLMGYLFGNILAVNIADLAWIYLGGIGVLIVIFTFWRSLLSITIHEELAQVEGIAVTTIRLILMLLIAAVIAVAMKIVGILLITALLIIPAATARHFARSPEQMAILASVFGSLSVLAGLLASYQFDTPAGPSIVLCSGLLFLVSTLLPKRQL